MHVEDGGASLATRNPRYMKKFPSYGKAATLLDRADHLSQQYRMVYLWFYDCSDPILVATRLEMPLWLAGYEVLLYCAGCY